MKILHIINNLGSGGAEKLIEETLPLMNNNSSISVELLLLTNEANVFEKGLKAANINISVVPIRRIRSPLNIFYIRKHIIKGKFDVVHVHLFPAQYWTAMACMFIKKRRPKLITTEHNTSNRRRGKKLFRYIDKFIYSKFNIIISISMATKKALDSWINLFGKSEEKSIVIENGINLEKFKNAKGYVKSEIVSAFTNETKILCMIGRFSTQKDHQTLIRAVAMLPENIHLLLIGEGELIKANKALVTNLSINDRIHFLGFRNDIEKIIKTVDILILSSNWEGFGLAALEGMSAGIVVLGTDVEGLSEVIGDEDQLFQVGDAKELANKIMVFLNDNQLYLNKANAGFTRSGKYDISNMVAKYIDIYQNY
ncbi:glycosyltransferase [Paenibacillus sp. FSL R10-2199]|uniref:glycosyltransferase n=1 Tax=Paenibacillus sp. FSL R10-2199 TaxID=2975348 RepID=UPI0030F8AEE3